MCGKLHNTLVHVDNPPQSAYTRHVESCENQDPQVTSAECNDQVLLLQPAFVDVLDRLGRPIKYRVLLDLKHYDSTTRRDDEGRFVVEIPSSKRHQVLATPISMH